jgi:Double zinc ribbon
MRTCPNCGAALQHTRPFCSRCGVLVGAEVPGQPAEGMSCCANCNTGLIEGAQFCFNCGMPVGPASVSPLLSAGSGPPLTDPLALCMDALARRTHGRSNRPLMEYLAGWLRATPGGVPAGDECLAAFQMCWDAGVDAPILDGAYRPVGPVRDALVVLFDDRLSLTAVTAAGPVVVKVLEHDAIWDANELQARLSLAKKTPAVQASTVDGVTILLFFPPSLPSDAIEAMRTELCGWLDEAADSNAGIPAPDDIV